MFKSLLALTALSVLTPHLGLADLVVQSRTITFNTNFLRWVAHHMATSGEHTIDLSVPSLEVYSNGMSIYYSNDAQKSAAFLRSFPENVSNVVSDCFRPSLKDTVEMLPELKAKEPELLTGARYTVMSLSYPNREDCKRQNEALEELKKHSAQNGIRIIEVHLKD